MIPQTSPRSTGPEFGVWLGRSPLAKRMCGQWLRPSWGRRERNSAALNFRVICGHEGKVRYLLAWRTYPLIARHQYSAARQRSTIANALSSELTKAYWRATCPTNQPLSGASLTQRCKFRMVVLAAALKYLCGSRCGRKLTSPFASIPATPTGLSVCSAMQNRLKLTWQTSTAETDR